MIPLIKNTFTEEYNTKKALADFVISASRLSMDEQCFAFEEKFAEFQGSKHGVLFNSGGSANLAMLQALKNMAKLRDGDKVGFSALTWATNVMPIIQLGLIPVPIDCDPKTLNVMSYNIQKTLKTHDLRAFFDTNALGFAGDLDNIKKLCHKNDILFLEDNCEALGTVLGGKKTGTFGLAATFSFFVAHHMSTIEGGMVCTNDDDLADMLRIVRANGWDRNLCSCKQQYWRDRFKVTGEFEAKYTFFDLGYNFRPTEITGFLGLYQLQFLEENVQRRQDNYLALEPIVKANPDFVTLDRNHISVLSCFAFPVLCKTPAMRDHYLSQFSGAGVEIRPMIAGNIQRQPFFVKYSSIIESLPGAEMVHECGFYCGNYPELTKSDLEVLRSCLQKT